MSMKNSNDTNGNRTRENYRSSRINVIVYSLITLTLRITSVQKATWLADRRSKADTCLRHAIF